MANKIQSVKGTREFYPEANGFAQFIYEKVLAQPQRFSAIRNGMRHSLSQLIFTRRNLAKNW